MKKLILIFLLFPFTALADDWTTQDTYRQLAVTTLITIDWLQTQEIVKDSEHYTESNKLLGKHPSMKRVNLMIGGSIVLCYVVARLLPKDWRSSFQYVVIGCEIGAISNNYGSGIRINGRF